MKELRFKILGSLIASSGAPGAWKVFYPGAEGKRGPADFVVPAEVAEQPQLIVE